MRRLALPLALLLVLAGCSAPGGQPRGTPASAVTPAPVPSENGTGGERLAPGLTADGVVDEEALAAAHRRALENRSYVVRIDATGRYRNGTTFLRYRTVARIGSDSRYLVVNERGGEFPPRVVSNVTRFVVWGDETIHVRRTVFENGTARSSVRRGESPYAFDHLGRSLAGTLGRADATLAGRNASGGTTAYLFTATEATDRSVPYGSRLENASGNLRAVVTEDGFVRSLSGRATGTHDRTGVPAQIRFTLQYEAIGEVSVERPDWATAALANDTETRTARGPSVP